MKIVPDYRSSYRSFASRRCSRGNGIPKSRFCKNCCASERSGKTMDILPSESEKGRGWWTYRIHCLRILLRCGRHERKQREAWRKPRQDRIYSFFKIEIVRRAEEIVTCAIGKRTGLIYLRQESKNIYTSSPALRYSSSIYLSLCMRVDSATHHRWVSQIEKKFCQHLR